MRYLLTSILITLLCKDSHAQNKPLAMSRGDVTVIPCKLDTLKGTMYYHTRDGYNNGNAWGAGYWVGKCGPSGILGEQIFIPGNLKITQLSKEGNQKKWTSTERVIDNGVFYDYEWKRIPSKDVYGLLIPNGGAAKAF